MLGAYIFIIMLLLLNISSPWIDPLIMMSCPSLSLITDFILKSILSDVSIATPAFFWFAFAWNFPSPHIQSICVPISQVGLL